MKTIFTILICILSSLAVFADPCENFYANFGYNNPNGGLVVLFNNLSEGDASEVLWSFGDGTESDALNPQHTYTTEGTYEICLTIENPTCHSETCKSVIIPETQPPICEAAFSYTMNGSTLVFDNNSVTSLNDFTHYIWHFGDETQSDNPNPTHTYAANGVYQVCLTVWNNETNCEDQVCQTITINNVPTPCEAAFSYTMNGSTLVFDNNSVTGMDDFNHYTWNFGDNTTNSDLANPTHTYAANGVYQVCLTVWNNETNCEDQVCQTITINNVPTPCEAAFSYTMNGSTLVFDNNSVTSLNDFTHYIWHFGDETQSDNPNPTHTYAANGVYQVCLTVWNNETNCEDQVCQTITINNVPTPCEAAFSYTMNGSTLVFDNNSVTGMDDFNHYTWNFGDNTTNSDLANPTHTYAANGVYQVCLTVWNNETNCEDQVCQTITINNVPTPCEAAFSYTMNGSTLVFDNNSVTGMDDFNHYTWNFGDNTTNSDLANPTHTYAANGVYQVCLTVWNNETNCEDQVCQTVTINNVPTPCEAAFSYTMNGSTLVFDNNSVTSLNDFTHYIWHFGDETQSDNPNPTHTYAANGVYQVCLTVWNNETNCEDQVCQTITINNVPTPCEAAFSYTMNGSTLVFDNNSVTSLNDFTHYIWHFGDETQSDNPNPTHTYAANGVYQVCLTVWNNETNCEDQVCQTITINNVPTPCEAAFSYTMNGSTLVFDNNSVTGMDDFNHYTWNFGDNTTNSDLANPTHTYAANGVYQVCLTVWNNETNCEDQVCQTITINNVPTPCEAAFSYTMNGSTLVFDNNSVTSLNDFTHYIWHFGDETQSDNPNPTHTYATNGVYQVCLTVWNNETNCEDQVCQTITINNVPTPCEAAFSYTMNGSTLVFDNNSVTGMDDFNHYTWNFGDNTTNSDLANPTHTYATNGVYQVCLTVWNNETNCEDQVCQTITINNVPTPCEAAFSYTMNGSTLVFDNNSVTSLNDFTHYIWHFGDETNSDLANPTHIYAANGVYQVCLTVWNNETNCEDQVCQTITINNVPTPCEAAFSYVVNGNVAIFTNTSTVGNANAYQSIWYNNNTAVSTQQNTTITFPTNGSYNICLVVYNDDINCEDNNCQTITINNVPTPCEAAFSYTMNGSTLVFDNNSVTGLNDFTHYIWHFGDETQSDNPNPTHTYAANGVYQVCLTIWNNETNCEDQVCQTITINNVPTPCEAAFSYTMNGSTLVFDNNSVTGMDDFNHYTWNFGDNTTNSDLANPTHTYAANGVYQVCLTIWNNETNCEDQVCQTITIAVEPPVTCEASFVYETNLFTAYFNANNSSTSSGEIVSYQWTLGDGATSDSPTPTHIYTANGTYQVCLTITTNNGCTDEHCGNVVIDAGQMNGLRINPNTISNGILNMEVTLMNPQHIHIGVFNSVGQDCFNQNANLPAGNTPLQLYTANTPTGVYIVQILFDNGFSMMQKVLITP